MKNRIILGCLCACALKLSAAEVETIPQEKSLKIAHQLVQAWAELDQTQLKINADESKPHALKAGKVSAMVIPDKSFSADSLKKPDVGVVPVGLLWTMNMAPAMDGKITSADKLRLITVKGDNEDQKLQLQLLGIRKKGDSLELVVYAKGKEPLISAPLKSVETKQELPVEITGEKAGENSGRLTFHILGRYEASILMMAMEE